MKGFLDNLLDRWVQKILSLICAIILAFFFQVNNQQERYISVPLIVETNENFSVSGNQPHSVRVLIKGSEDDIFDVLESDFIAKADFSGYSSEGEFKVPVQVNYSGINNILFEELEISVEPSNLTINQEEMLAKRLNVNVQLLNYPPHGYEMVQYSVSPRTILAQGPRSKIDELESIDTEIFDLSSFNETFNESVRLIIPDENIDLPSGRFVELRGTIAESIEVQTLSEIEVVALGIPENMVLTSELPLLTLTLQGKILDLETLNPRELYVEVDCSDITVPGTYTLPLRVDIPGDISVMQYYPQEAIISFDWPEETTP